MIRLALITVATLGCSDPYGDAQKADTIAAWESFVDENPRSPNEKDQVR